MIIYIVSALLPLDNSVFYKLNGINGIIIITRIDVRPRVVYQQSQ